MNSQHRNLLELPVVEQLSASVSTRLLGGLTVLVVEHPAVRGAVSLQGGQLLEWQPAGEQPVLWLSDEARYKPGTAIRGGVPVCWPWFGTVGEPAHGFARILPWELTGHEEDAEGVGLVLTLRADERTRGYWPHEFTLISRIRLGGRQCSVELEAYGNHRTTAALHTYLRIGALGAAEVSGLGGAYTDRLHDGTEAGQGREEGAFTPTGHTERIYPQADEVSRITDRAFGRTVEMRHGHHSDVVVWNPGPELSRSMADVPDSGYREFLCVETARIAEPLVATADRPARLETVLSLGRTQ
ncbi:D-hexose-6-phosphate mutarotase [Streptomyces sp. NPDC002054]|uniref:D-hexose-6-phosphate mutarotase n=1 Tax=Streptomyces sp. NPDC002054 TaxID=3154663 RepID=UPI0033252E1F